MDYVDESIKDVYLESVQITPVAEELDIFIDAVSLASDEPSPDTQGDTCF